MTPIAVMMTAKVHLHFHVQEVISPLRWSWRLWQTKRACASLFCFHSASGFAILPRLLMFHTQNMQAGMLAHISLPAYNQKGGGGVNRPIRAGLKMAKSSTVGPHRVLMAARLPSSEAPHLFSTHGMGGPSQGCIKSADNRRRRDPLPLDPDWLTVAHFT